MKCNPLLLLILIPLALSGCVQTDPPGSLPPSQVNQPITLGTNITLQWAENVTTLLPIYASTQVDLTTAITLRGAKEDGFAIKYIFEDPAKAGFVDFAPRYDRLGFATSVSESRVTNERTVQCWDGSTQEPCSRENLTHAPFGPVDYVHANLFTELLSIPPGLGYLLIDAKSWGNVTLELAFSAPVSWGSEIRQENGSFWWGQEFFHAEYAQITRCSMVAWCGVMFGGRLELDFAGHHFIIFDDYATANAGYMRLCMIQRTGTCAQLNEARAYPLIALAKASEGPAFLTLDAASAPGTPVGATAFVSTFHAGNYAYRFSVPDQHPLAT